MSGDLFEERMKELTIDEANLKNRNLAVGLAGQSLAMNQRDEPGIIEEQLSLEKQIETIDNLIQSNSLEYNPSKKCKEWVHPDITQDILNEDKIILSDFGVHRFRQVISGYLHKGLLLSNYTHEEIQLKMLDIVLDINDTIFQEYEKIFYRPSIERCEAWLNEEISEKLEIKKIAHSVLGLEMNEKVEKEKILKELEFELEKKVHVIREKLFKQKIKQFPLLLRIIQDNIHNCYARAEGGQERRSLRQHMQITETTGLNIPMQEKKGLLGRMGLK